MFGGLFDVFHPVLKLINLRLRFIITSLPFVRCAGTGFIDPGLVPGIRVPGQALSAVVEPALQTQLR